MITITHTRAEGTLIGGSAKGDGVYQLLRGLADNWAYFPSIGLIGLRQSRDKEARTPIIERAAAALRAAGHEVTVSVSETRQRPFGEAEAGRYEQAEDRADRFAGYAASAAGRRDAAYDAEHAILDAIPPGQPILTGHHSERGHRRALERAEQLRRRGSDEAGKARYHASRAEASSRFRENRESVPTTLRRIARLEAEARQVQRRLDGTDPIMNHGKPAEGEWRARLTRRAEEIADELAYWREHVARCQEEGARVWSRADFQRGDYALARGLWYEVLRVNAKSVTVPGGPDTRPVVTAAGRLYTWNGTIPYDEVTGHATAGQMRRQAPRPDSLKPH